VLIGSPSFIAGSYLERYVSDEWTALMELSPVSFKSLSSITYVIALPRHERFKTPEFVHVSFSGRYRDGAEGAPDATFIVAIMEAVQRAWYSECLIIDLTDLTYEWGDNMAWVYGIGWSGKTRCHKPLAIIVSEKCRKALRTLSPDDFDDDCVDSLDEAVDLVRSKKPEYDRCIDEWRQNPTKAT